MTKANAVQINELKTMSMITQILTVTLVFFLHLLVVSHGNPAQPGQQPQPNHPPANLNPNPHADGDVTAEEAREYVDAHNRVRTGKGLPHLTWDNKLANYAKWYAGERVNDCKMEHSVGPYGENLFWGGRDHWTPAKAVNEWAGEVQFYDEKTQTCKPGEVCGHYTQIISTVTQRVGCSHRKCTHEGWYFVCNYDPW